MHVDGACVLRDLPEVLKCNVSLPETTSVLPPLSRRFLNQGFTTPREIRRRYIEPQELQQP